MAETKFRINFTLFDQDGNELARLDTKENVSVPLGEMPEAMQQMYEQVGVVCAMHAVYDKQQKAQDLSNFEESVMADLAKLGTVEEK